MSTYNIDTRFDLYFGKAVHRRLYSTLTESVQLCRVCSVCVCVRVVTCVLCDLQTFKCQKQNCCWEINENFSHNIDSNENTFCNVIELELFFRRVCMVVIFFCSAIQLNFSFFHPCRIWIWIWLRFFFVFFWPKSAGIWVKITRILKFWIKINRNLSFYVFILKENNFYRSGTIPIRYLNGEERNERYCTIGDALMKRLEVGSV